jgi:hypothetical protein
VGYRGSRADLPAVPGFRGERGRAGRPTAGQAAGGDLPDPARADLAEVRLEEPPGSADVAGLHPGPGPLRAGRVRRVGGAGPGGRHPGGAARLHRRPGPGQRRAARRRGSCRRGWARRRCTSATGRRCCARTRRTTGASSRPSRTTCPTCGRRRHSRAGRCAGAGRTRCRWPPRSPCSGSRSRIPGRPKGWPRCGTVGTPRRPPRTR